MQINWLEYDIHIIRGGTDCKICFMDMDREHNRLTICGSDKYSDH